VLLLSKDKALEVEAPLEVERIAAPISRVAWLYPPQYVGVFVPSWDPSAHHGQRTLHALHLQQIGPRTPRAPGRESQRREVLQILMMSLQLLLGRPY